jgi:hypothetical protein
MKSFIRVYSGFHAVRCRHRRCHPFFLLPGVKSADRIRETETHQTQRLCFPLPGSSVTVAPPFTLNLLFHPHSRKPHSSPGQTRALAIKRPGSLPRRLLLTGSPSIPSVPAGSAPTWAARTPPAPSRKAPIPSSGSRPKRRRPRRAGDPPLLRRGEAAQGERDPQGGGAVSVSRAGNLPEEWTRNPLPESRVALPFLRRFATVKMLIF